MSRVPAEGGVHNPSAFLRLDWGKLTFFSASFA